MAVDSIIANPTKSVLEIVFDSSGCWAIERNAWATAFASPIAGAIEPTIIVNPDITIETIPIMVSESIM
jgi:hypothetical protein